MMAGKRRAGCAAEWRAQPFIVLGIAVFTAGLKRLARNMAQQTPIHQLIKKQKTLKIGLGLQSETACRRVDAVFAHFGRAVAPLKWARAIRTEPLRGISTSFGVARPGKPGPALRRSKYLRGFSRRLKTAPTRRLWVQTEMVKAHLAQYEHGDEAAAGRAAKWLSAVQDVYLKPNGTWIDQLGPSGLPILKPVPASTFYHILCMITEADRLANKDAAL